MALLFLLCAVSLPHSIDAQIIFPERFAVILDTTKVVKGQIVPEMKFQTQKERLLEFENNANITFRLGDNALTFANKIEFSKYGDEVFLSGGYLYSELRKIVGGSFVFEPYGQVHWSDARGMELRYAFGINARFRIRTTDNLGVFAGIGAFYEHEKWNYDGVADSSLIPSDVEHVKFTGAKVGFYLSIKYSPIRYLFFDSSIYHQGIPGDLFSTPRLASSNGVTLSFTEHLGVTLIYQNIYDYAPLVPIDRLFTKVVTTLAVSF